MHKSILPLCQLQRFFQQNANLRPISARWSCQSIHFIITRNYSPVHGTSCRHCKLIILTFCRSQHWKCNMLFNSLAQFSMMLNYRCLLNFQGKIIAETTENLPIHIIDLQKLSQWKPKPGKFNENFFHVSLFFTSRRNNWNSFFLGRRRNARK